MPVNLPVTQTTPSPTPTPSIGYTPPASIDPGNPDSWWTWFVGVPLRIILIVLIGTVALAILRRLIRRVSNRIAEGTPWLKRRGLSRLGQSHVGDVLLRANPLASARRSQRARTIGSVLTSTVNIVVGVTIALMVLDQLGVNLAPFLASAGIVGVALGFGAQSLVKDFLSGTFMLLEDQYGVGDVVDFGEVVGTVEEVALRVTRVRDVAGTLWSVRNGEILRTGNKTQEWGRAVVEVRVPYLTDIAKTRQALRTAADDVSADRELGPNLLEPAEVLGVESVTAEALLFKVQVKTRAAMQWEVSRSLRAAIRDRLTAAGIPMASDQQLVLMNRSPATPNEGEAMSQESTPKDASARDAGPGCGTAPGNAGCEDGPAAR